LRPPEALVGTLDIATSGESDVDTAPWGGPGLRLGDESFYGDGSRVSGSHPCRNGPERSLGLLTRVEDPPEHTVAGTTSVIERENQ